MGLFFIFCLAAETILEYVGGNLAETRPHPLYKWYLHFCCCPEEWFNASLFLCDCGVGDFTVNVKSIARFNLVSQMKWAFLSRHSINALLRHSGHHVLVVSWGSLPALTFVEIDNAVCLVLLQWSYCIGSYVFTIPQIRKCCQEISHAEYRDQQTTQNTRVQKSLIPRLVSSTWRTSAWPQLPSG